MSKPRKRRRSRKPNPQPIIRQQKKSPQVRKSRSFAAMVSVGVSAILALIGVAAAVATFWPRVTVTTEGTFSDPSTIVFVANNTGYIPLRYPVMEMWECEIGYGQGEPDRPPTPCSMPPPSAYRFGEGQKWLDRDEPFPTRLEDWISFVNPTRQIIRANIIITMDYCPWYFPFRFQKSFGFKSAKGSDGQLYWRAYEPQPSDYQSGKTPASQFMALACTLSF